MEMSFQGYIDNPLGIKGSVYSQRDTMKSIYTTKFDNIFLREAGKIEYKLYYNKNKDEYYIHLKIPSEEVEGFYYDVVIQFYTKNNALRINNSLVDYSVRFFSNDPAFVYTYLRVFMKHDMFIKFLGNKFPKIARKADPVQRNPYETPGYVKSLYFTFLFMKLRSLFTKSLYQEQGIHFSEGAISSKIRPFHVIMEEREQKKSENRKKKIDSKKKAKPNDISPTGMGDINRQATVKRTKNVKMTPKVGTASKTVKKVKSVKRI